jgi:hypothetical protein
MRTVTDPEGNGGNPHVETPVRLPFRLPPVTDYSGLFLTGNG